MDAYSEGVHRVKKVAMCARLLGGGDEVGAVEPVEGGWPEGKEIELQAGRGAAGPPESMQPLAIVGAPQGECTP